MKNVRYSSVIPAEIDAACAECEGTATVHVCFEDGSGVSVCQKCFTTLVNEGKWITDDCQVLLAS